MKKLLIVTKDAAYGPALKKALEPVFDEVILSSHGDALENFLTEEPSHVLVLEYYEEMSQGSEYADGFETWRELKASSIAENQVLLRASFMDYDYDDFLRLPIQLAELLKKFKV